MKINKFIITCFAGLSLIGFMISLTGCATVPRESVELSNTVGRDLEEVHRSHRALASLLFDIMEKDVNTFIDEIYAPAYIKEFATDFRLDNKVRGIVANAPNNLLPVLIRFVEKSNNAIEQKRAELLDPIKKQRNQVINGIDASYRQIHAAQAVITGHLASVVKVHDAQNELLKNAGLEGMREQLAENTQKASSTIADLIQEAEQAEGRIDRLEIILMRIKNTINSIKSQEK